MTTDATTEALADLLAANPRGVAYVCDELTGWTRSMNQYKGSKGSDRQFWLSLWNGSPFIINRRGRKHPLPVDAPFVGVVGGLPPSVLRELVADEQSHQDGFVHRILFSFPEHVPLAYTEDGISPANQQALDTVVQRLWALEPTSDEDGQLEPVVIPFSALGKEVWRSWITEHYVQEEEFGLQDSLRGAWAKMSGYAARLALILQMCRWACDEALIDAVDETSMAGAAQLIDYFKAHVRRIYQYLGITPEDKRIDAAISWIGRQRGLHATVRELVTAHVGGVRTSDEAKALLRELHERGYGIVQETPLDHGRQRVQFTLYSRHAARSNKARS
jgi:hypothetical protein